MSAKKHTTNEAASKAAKDAKAAADAAEDAKAAADAAEDAKAAADAAKDAKAAADAAKDAKAAADAAAEKAAEAEKAAAVKPSRVSKKQLEKALNWAETQSLSAEETQKLMSSIEEHLDRGLLWQNNDGTRDFIAGQVDEETVRNAALSPAPGRRFLWNNELL